MLPHRGSWVAALALIVAGCRDTPRPEGGAPGDVPAALKVPAGRRLVLKALAKGAQVYVCADAGGGAFAWKLEGPEAELLDPEGKTIGKHYAGPTWEAADGSKVVGQVAAKVDAPTPGAIQWLLLDARPAGGAGLFAGVKSVQRVDTRGGVAPASGCDAQHVGSKARVDYQATYRFYAE
jgi:hypothetical protein